MRSNLQDCNTQCTKLKLRGKISITTTAWTSYAGVQSYFCECPTSSSARVRFTLRTTRAAQRGLIFPGTASMDIDGPLRATPAWLKSTREGDIFRLGSAKNTLGETPGRSQRRIGRSPPARVSHFTSQISRIITSKSSRPSLGARARTTQNRTWNKLYNSRQLFPATPFGSLSAMRKCDFANGIPAAKWEKAARLIRWTCACTWNN